MWHPLLMTDPPSPRCHKKKLKFIFTEGKTGIRHVWREMSWQEWNHNPRIGFSPYSPHRQNWILSQTQWKGQRGVGARGAEIELFSMTVCTKRNDDHQLSSHTYQYKSRQPGQRPPSSNFPSKRLIPPEKSPNCNLLQQEPRRLQRTSNALQVRASAWACIAAITKLLVLLVPAKSAGDAQIFATGRCYQTWRCMHPDITISGSVVDDVSSFH